MRRWRLALIGLSSLWMACGPEPVVECTSPAECDDGEECTLDLCDQGTCKNNADDTIIPAQGSTLDCKQEVCSGGIKSQIANNAETPNDNVPCTADSCVNGSPVFNPNDNACGTPGDCKALVCDPQGALGTPDNNGCSAITNNNNTPNDNASCTTDSCLNGTPIHIANNAVCVGVSGETATCVLEACDPTDPGADPVSGCAVTFDDLACSDGNFCTDDACDPTGVGADGITGCTITPNIGQPTQIDGNCQLEVCNNGNPSQSPDDTDIPSADTDGVGCTNPGCSGGLIVETPNDNNCNDGLGCTLDFCDAVLDCSVLADSSSCDPGEGCDPNQDPGANPTGCVNVDTCPPTLAALENGTVNGDTTSLVSDINLSCGDNTVAHPDLAFALDLAVDSDVLISVQGGHEFAIGLTDLAGGACGTELLCVNSAPALIGFLGDLAIINLAAGSYAIIIDGSGATLQAGAFDLTVVSDPTTITAGDLVINELHADVRTPLLDANAEFFEIANPSNTFFVSTAGLLLVEDDGSPVNQTLTQNGANGAQLFVEPGGFLLGVPNVDTALNGGLTQEFDLLHGLNNTPNETFVITKGATIIDSVNLIAVGSAGTDGVSFQLDPLVKDADLNDLAAAWCETPTASYTTGNRGTPNTENESCTPPACTVGTQAADCNDNQACTDDVCVAGACQNNPDNTNTAVSDGFACTSEACVAGNTVITQNDNLCDDGVGCTLDFCTGTGGAAVTGCEVLADDTLCLANETCDVVNDCQAGGPVCGNGIIEAGEECDGGVTCDAACQRIPVCGDGFIDAPETCDDSNTSNGDGCDATCQIEPPPGGLVLNEFDYDQVGGDTLEFVEVFNGSGVTVSLTPWPPESSWSLV
jgi:cysteine-rich repeat protein